jgi:hypothetical protein
MKDLVVKKKNRDNIPTRLQRLGLVSKIRRKRVVCPNVQALLTGYILLTCNSREEDITGSAELAETVAHTAQHTEGLPSTISDEQQAHDELATSPEEDVAASTDLSETVAHTAQHPEKPPSTTSDEQQGNDELAGTALESEEDIPSWLFQL